MILLLASALAAASPAPVQFNVGGTALSMPMPTGYCLPAGAQITVAQMLAAADHSNVTDAHIVRCDGKAPGEEDYTMIKTPVQALPITIDRPQIIDLMIKTFDDPQAKTDLSPDAINKDAAGALSSTFGANVKLNGAIVPLGHDDTCFYMGGILEINAKDIQYKQSVGGCMTSVGGRVITIYRYDRSNTDAGVLALLREANAIARSVQPAK